VQSSGEEETKVTVEEKFTKRGRKIRKPQKLTLFSIS